jgi:hypothetical protein
MAITETRALPAKFIEELGTDYAGQLKAATAKQLPTSSFAPSVAGQTALQQQATALTGAGIGSYQPFLTGAGSGTQAAGAAQQGQIAQQGLGLAQQGLGLATGELTGAGAALGTAGATTAAAQPFIGQAGQGLTQAGATLGGVPSYISGAQAGLGAAGALTGTGENLAAVGATPTAGSVASYMSPFQSQVIDTTLAEFDRQAKARQQAISDQAVALGGFGGGREGVLQSEYQTGSDRNRAALEAQLQAQGFSQAQAARQADLQNQMMLSQGQLGLGQATAGLSAQQAQLAQGQLGLGQAQLGLGQAQAGQAGQQAGMAGQRAALAGAQQNLAQGSLGLGQFQTGLGGALQGFQGTDIARAGQVGAADQAQAQAVLGAQQEANRLAAYEPLERLGIYGQGVTGLMGGYPAQYQFTSQPNPSPLAQALGIGSTLGGIYGNVMGPVRGKIN